MADTAKTAAKDAPLSLLGGLMTLKVDVLNAKRAEETVEFKLICPDEDNPTRPVQMYVHPDDLDGANPRMWKVGELDKAREVDGILYRATPEEIAAAKETVLPTGQMSVTVVPAIQFNTVANGAFYRLRPKEQPAVYAALVKRIAADTDLAYITELTIRGKQRFYRLIVVEGVLSLQEHIRPGELYDAEEYSTDTDPKLIDMLGDAVRNNVEDFDPEEYVNFLRTRAEELDAAKRDPNAPKVEKAPRAKVDDTAGLLAALESAAKAKKRRKAS
jgi:non-homologous end joining protein Ku